MCVDAELTGPADDQASPPHAIPSHPPPSLVTSAGPGRIDSAAAVSELLRAHHLELVRLAVLMTGDLASAEDVVQDVFEAMHRRWPSLRSGISGLAYARAGVLNRCRSVHRRNAIRRKHAADLAELPGSGPDAASAAADRDVLATALRELPRRQREVIVLRYYCDLDAGEIAAVLRIGPSAVRSTMSRGLAALALAMGEDDR
jgi:RNA polymerase sigma-70 factor (sigma-E family)